MFKSASPIKQFEEKGDKSGIVWEMYDDLKEAGFEDVDCLLKDHNLAIIAAVKS